jgi:ADP-ribose pyrophosphatase YjhB (NUDIX family)
MKFRKAARIIAINSERRVLLFQHERANGELFWATPGGGLEEGETYETAAAREAAEELGADHIDLKALWDHTNLFQWLDHQIQQEERFFLAQFEQVDLPERVRSFHALERIRQVRWWSIAELEQTGESVFPEDLSQRLKKLEGR